MFMDAAAHLRGILFAAPVQRPIPVAQESDRGFWLLRPREGQMSEQARLFHNWLLNEARQPS